jgi:hypothetical protein
MNISSIIIGKKEGKRRKKIYTITLVSNVVIIVLKYNKIPN